MREVQKIIKKYSKTQERRTENAAINNGERSNKISGKAEIIFGK